MCRGDRLVELPITCAIYRVASRVLLVAGAYVSRFFDLINFHRREKLRPAPSCSARPVTTLNRVRRETVLLNRQSRIKSARRPGHVERGSLETKLLELLQRGTSERANERMNGRTNERANERTNERDV